MTWLAPLVDVSRGGTRSSALIVARFGIGCVFGPMVTVAMHAESRTAGAASDVLN
ncbi:hypothetical protein IL992_29075 [Microbispora sp. NEAU-D428]|uniref:hypothetical protein n=1 Tax=Microbispora sitophila TaxID=2771537 RepID=UPI0018686CC9|nr:hypothetical protein [Microbispora sitophila]MBE3013207.1 hypothetical protein [Microbispora sitophila]